MTVKEDKPERKGRQQYAELLCDFVVVEFSYTKKN